MKPIWEICVEKTTGELVVSQSVQPLNFRTKWEAKGYRLTLERGCHLCNDNISTSSWVRIRGGGTQGPILVEAHYGCWLLLDPDLTYFK